MAASDIITVTADGDSTPLSLKASNYYELWAIFETGTTATVQWNRDFGMSGAPLATAETKAKIGNTHTETSTENIQTSSGTIVSCTISGLSAGGKVYLASKMISKF